MSRKTYIDESATVHSNARLDEGVMVWNWSKIREGVTIGDDTNIGQGVYIDFDTKIGKRCKIQNNVSVYHGVSVGDDVFIGPHATLTNDLVPRAHNEDWCISKTIIEDGVSIGANATVICGVTLGAHCMIGAGAVVTSDIPAHGLVVGNPARVIDYVTVSGKRLHVPDPSTPPPLDALMDKDL